MTTLNDRNSVSTVAVLSKSSSLNFSSLMFMAINLVSMLTTFRDSFATLLFSLSKSLLIRSNAVLSRSPVVPYSEFTSSLFLYFSLSSEFTGCEIVGLGILLAPCNSGSSISFLFAARLMKEVKLACEV